MSLSRVGLIGGISLDWVGLDNWTRLFSDGAVGARAGCASIVYFVLTVGLEMTLGIAIALRVHELVCGQALIALSLMLHADVHGAGDRRPARPLPDRLHLRALRVGAAARPGSTPATSSARRPSAFLAVTLMDVWEWTPLIALIVLAGLDLGARAGARGGGDGRRGLLAAAALHRAADDRRRDDRRAADPLDGRDPLLRHHHQHHQRRPGGRDEDRPDPPLRDRVPLLRPRLRGRDRALDAGRLDPASPTSSCGILKRRGLAR